MVTSQNPHTGWVIPIGDDAAINVKVDEKVVCPKHTGTEIHLEGTDAY